MKEVSVKLPAGVPTGEFGFLFAFTLHRRTQQACAPQMHNSCFVEPTRNLTVFEAAEQNVPDVGGMVLRTGERFHYDLTQG